MPQMHLRMTHEMKNQIKKIADQKGIKPNQFILFLIEKTIFNDVIDSGVTENFSTEKKLAKARSRVMFKSALETLLISRCLLMVIDKQSGVEEVIKKANELVAQYYGEAKDNSG